MALFNQTQGGLFGNQPMQQPGCTSFLLSAFRQPPHEPAPILLSLRKSEPKPNAAPVLRRPLRSPTVSTAPDLPFWSDLFLHGRPVESSIRTRSRLQSTEPIESIDTVDVVTPRGWPFRRDEHHGSIEPHGTNQPNGTRWGTVWRNLVEYPAHTKFRTVRITKFTIKLATTPVLAFWADQHQYDGPAPVHFPLWQSASVTCFWRGTFWQHLALVWRDVRRTELRDEQPFPYGGSGVRRRDELRRNWVRDDRRSVDRVEFQLATCDGRHRNLLISIITKYLLNQIGYKINLNKR